MIELNLLPEEFKKKKKKIELPNIPIVPITAGFAAVLIIIQLLLWGLVFLNKKQLAHLTGTWKAVEPKKQELDATKKAIFDMSKKQKTIENLIEKRRSWSSVLNELSNSLTANVWLTQISYSRGASGAGITIRGFALGKTERVYRFLKAMKENGNFSKDFRAIELVSAKQALSSGEEVVDFTIFCKFKEKT